MSCVSMRTCDTKQVLDGNDVCRATGERDTLTHGGECDIKCARNANAEGRRFHEFTMWCDSGLLRQKGTDQPITSTDQTC